MPVITLTYLEFDTNPLVNPCINAHGLQPGLQVSALIAAIVEMKFSFNLFELHLLQLTQLSFTVLYYEKCSIFFI